MREHKHGEVNLASFSKENKSKRYRELFLRVRTTRVEFKLVEVVMILNIRGLTKTR